MTIDMGLIPIIPIGIGIGIGNRPSALSIRLQSKKVP